MRSLGLTVRWHSSGIVLFAHVPAGSAARGGDVVFHVKDTHQPSLPTPFYSVLESVSVFMAFATVFHSIKSSDNYPLSHCGLLVLFLPYWSFEPSSLI